MPFCRIPPEKLEMIGLFGFTVINETETHALISCELGEFIVAKSAPWLLFEDMNDAMQLGALGVVKTP